MDQRIRRCRPKFLISLLILCYFLAGCGWFEMDVPPGGIIFQDDFTVPGSGWDRLNEDEHTADYENGGYRITVHEPATLLWARPKLDLIDVRVIVSATKLGGPDDNSYGIICRYQDANNFHFFLISSDGYSGIGTFQDGVKSLLTGEAMLPSEAILKGDQTNHLQADCVGDRLIFFVNGAQVGSVIASNNAHGDVGLIAGTGDITGTDILFDNFSVTKP
jgi:hypothetical protein